MNKNFLFFLLLLSVVLPAQAQPIKGAGQVVKGLTGEGLEKAFSSYMHAPGMAGKVAQTQVAQLHQRVLAASKAAFATPFSPAEIRRLTAIKAGSPRLVASIFSAPSNEMVSLLRHEFLTLTGVQKVSVSVEQSQLALHLFRRGLIINTNAFSHLASYTSVAELEQAIKTGKELYGPSALQAFADVSALGAFGNAQDVNLLLSFYNAAAQTVLEPVAFQSVHRALLAIGENKAAGELAARAGKVNPGDEEIFAPLLANTSPMTAIHAQFTPEATETYLNYVKQARASVVAEAVAEKPAEVSATQKGAIPDEVNPFSGLTLDLPSIDLSLKPQEGLVERKAPAVEETPVVEGDYSPVVPVLERKPSRGAVSHRYPSGLQDEEYIISNWLEYFKNGYFRPRDQIEAISGMSAAKANNLMEYLYYMPLEEAERLILEPLKTQGRLPDFMYDARLIEGTVRLPAGYYKNKFNENVKRFVELAEEEGSAFLHYAELKDLAIAMEDYSFEQGFRYPNDPAMAAALRRNWKELVTEIQNSGYNMNRAKINELWQKPVNLTNGKTISLREYFTQTRPTAFFKEGRMPEFYLNSKKWVSWENERRNLAAQEYIAQENVAPRSWLERVQDFFVLGNRDKYLTLSQFGDIMAAQYRKTFGGFLSSAPQGGDVLAEPEGEKPESLQVRVNNFDKVGGVCQASFGDGGYMGRVEAGYDGTSLVNRFELVTHEHVPVVTFDFPSLTPRVVTLASVPYVKDIKKPEVDKLRASTMVGDGLDPTRDLLSVEQAEVAVLKVPHLKATIYPHSRLPGWNLPQYLTGGGLGAYLSLFTPDFYPIKTVKRLRKVDGKWQLVPEYFIRKEVPALSGFIHRDHLTFTEQVQDRIETPATPEKK